MKQIIVIMGLLAVLLGTADAQPRLGFYMNPEAHSACVTIAGQSLQEVYVLCLDGPSMMAIEFTIASPPCANISWYYEEQFPLTVVDNNYVGVNFGACLTPPIHILTLYLVSPTWDSEDPCCFWGMENVNAWGCDTLPLYPYSFSGGSYLSPEPCELVESHTPFPVDGAVNVPTDVVLSWESGPLTQGPSCFVIVNSIMIGTDPNDLSWCIDVVSPWQPYFSLQPSTTYYWRVVMMTFHGDGPGPSTMWSFTTESAVPIERTSWGFIKSLYD